MSNEWMILDQKSSQFQLFSINWIVQLSYYYYLLVILIVLTPIIFLSLGIVIINP
jgi:hypothetical protein